jgi:hypothetical protein
LWAKGLNAKDIHKEMFSVYGETCLLRKAVLTCIEKFSRGRSKVPDDGRPGAEVAETTDKRLLCCGFGRSDKQCDKYISADGEYIEKLTSFQVRISHVLRIVSILTYLLTAFIVSIEYSAVNLI